MACASAAAARKPSIAASFRFAQSSWNTNPTRQSLSGRPIDLAQSATETTWRYPAASSRAAKVQNVSTASSSPCISLAFNSGGAP